MLRGDKGGRDSSDDGLGEVEGASISGIGFEREAV